MVHTNPALLLSDAPSLSSPAFAQAKDAVKKDAHGDHKDKDGGEGGEGGEGGHGEHHTGDLATDDVAFLTQLGLVEGHLKVGMELYRANLLDDAAVHMKHPEQELYADLRPALTARKAKEFDKTLEALAQAVEKKKPVTEADAAFSAVMADMKQVRASVKTNLRTKLEVVTHLVKTAAEEYEEGVEGGKVVNPKEYQDGYGFTTFAKGILDSLTPAERGRADVQRVEKELTALVPMAWPSIVKTPEKVDFDHSKLQTAASRIELVAHSVK